MAERESFKLGTFKLDAEGLYKIDPEGADREAFGFQNKENLGSLAAELLPPTEGAGDINIVNDYVWSMTNTRGRTDIPFIKLKEYRANESSVKRAGLFFASGGDFLTSSGARQSRTNGVLDVYDEIFPRDNPTGWRYTFPFFSETNVEISTKQWKTIDAVEGVKGAIAKAGNFGASITNLISLAQGAKELLLKGFVGGAVNIFDRPHVFDGHNYRNIQIQFPLYNTITPADNDKGGAPWKDNKDFIFLFTNQNLFNKRNLTTGIGPVFYEVLIPGQFYSVACCVTDFKVTNVGAIRTLYSDSGKPFIVPDVYQISITLTDMIMPSRNSFQASETLEGYNRVISRDIVGNKETSTDQDVVQTIITAATEVKNLSGR